MTGREEAGAWVAAFYAFRPIANPERLRGAVERACSERGLRGTVLIAPEGVNAALAGCRRDIEKAIEGCLPGVAGRVQWSRAATGNRVFDRLKVRTKPEIVTFDLALDAKAPVAKPVPPTDWNRLIEDPNTLTLDTRNAFESARGTFRGARAVNTASFREFRAYAASLCPGGQRRIAMFCTGGIRCEKASALLLERGFDEVYQLEGGILRYLAEVPVEQSAFEGECFVFDQREAVVRDEATGLVTEHDQAMRASMPDATKSHIPS